MFVLCLSAVSIKPDVLSAMRVVLAWEANSEPDLAGYKLHYGLTSRQYSTIEDVGLTFTSYRSPACRERLNAGGYLLLCRNRL